MQRRVIAVLFCAALGVSSCAFYDEFSHARTGVAPAARLATVAG
jgi:hypothetical protein